jgi:hypothetical protein
MSLFQHYIEQAQLNTVMIRDLYNRDELDDNDDDADTIAHMVDYYDPTHYPVKILSSEQLKKLKTTIGDMTVLQAYKNHADKDQKSIVKSKSKKFDDNRVIVLDGNKVIDGNHHVIAAIQLNKTVKAINIK